MSDVLDQDITDACIRKPFEPAQWTIIVIILGTLSTSLTLLFFTCCLACKVSRHLSKSIHHVNFSGHPDVIVVEEFRDLQRANSTTSNQLTLNANDLSQFYDKLPSNEDIEKSSNNPNNLSVDM